MLEPVVLACALFVIDGDTLRCGPPRGGERIRLLGIDAPELPGHCRRGRACAPGDPAASKRSLEGAIGKPATIERHGRDRYGRTLANVIVNGIDLSCYQLLANAAVYRKDWDIGGRVARLARHKGNGRGSRCSVSGRGS